MPLRALIFLTLFSLPFYVVRFTVFGLPTTLLEIILLATFIAWILPGLKNIFNPASGTRLPILRSWYIQTRKKLDKCWWPTIIFLVSSILAVFTSPDLIPALGHWRAYILEPILFALVLVDTIKTERDRQLVIYALASSLVIPVAVALYQQITGLGIPEPFWAAASTRRVTSIYGYPNAYALYAAPVTILLIASMRSVWDRAASDRSLLHRASFLAPAIGGTTLALAAIAGVFFTRSKGGIAALLVGMVILAMRGMKKNLKVKTVILIGAVGAFLIWQVNLRGFSTIQGGDSISVRLTQYRETWEMLRDRPFTGAGLRGYQTAMVPYHKQNYIEIFMYPHNLFLAVWSELGLLGLIAFIWILITFFKSTYASICHSRPVSRYGAGFSGNPEKKQKSENSFWFLFSRSRIPALEPSAQYGAGKSGMTIEPFNNLTIQPFNHAVMAAMVALLVHGLVDVPYFKNDLAVLFWTLIALPISRQAAPRNIEGIIGNYHEFFSEIMKRLAACSIDMKKLPVSHLCYRVASIQRYETVRDQLKPFCASMAEYEFNGRPDAILQLRNPLELSKGWQVSFIELPAPKTSHVYPEGLEHCGFVMGEELPAFHERNKSVLTGKKDHGPYCQPSFITFENGTTAKFYDRPLKEIVRLEGKQFISVS